MIKLSQACETMFNHLDRTAGVEVSMDAILEQGMVECFRVTQWDTDAEMLIECSYYASRRAATERYDYIVRSL
jgi:hypothetical protein